MIPTTAIHRAVAIALIAIFGLGTPAVSAAFAVPGGCQSDTAPAGCCCGVSGEDCGCGGTCCDSEPSPAQDNDTVPNDHPETPAIVCLCGFGDSVPAVPAPSPVSVDALMQASSATVTEVLDIADRPTGIWSFRIVPPRSPAACSVLRL